MWMSAKGFALDDQQPTDQLDAEMTEDAASSNSKKRRAKSPPPIEQGQPSDGGEPPTKRAK